MTSLRAWAAAKISRHYYLSWSAKQQSAIITSFCARCLRKACPLNKTVTFCYISGNDFDFEPKTNCAEEADLRDAKNQ